jgi:tRNA (uracil-5-)-methyltransferase TRM9
LKTDREDPGRALIYVWALEQKNSRRGWDENSPQDVFVPWVLQKGNKNKNQPKQQGQKQSKAVSRTERQQRNEISVTSTETPGEGVTTGDSEDKGKEAEASPVYNRYYHLYKQGELEFDAAEAGGKVIESGYEKDNHWAIIIPA